MDQQAQHTPPKEGTDSKEAEEKDFEKETDGQQVRTEVNHQESGNMLGETTSTSTGTGPETFNNQTSVAEAASSATQTKLMDEIADGVRDATKSQIKALLGTHGNGVEDKKAPLLIALQQLVAARRAKRIHDTLQPYVQVSDLVGFASNLAAMPLSVRSGMIDALLESGGVPSSERPQITQSALDPVVSDPSEKSPVPPSTPKPAGGDGVLRDSPTGPLEMLQEAAVLEQETAAAAAAARNVEAIRVATITAAQTLAREDRAEADSMEAAREEHMISQRPVVPIPFALSDRVTKQGKTRKEFELSMRFAADQLEYTAVATGELAAVKEAIEVAYFSGHFTTPRDLLMTIRAATSVAGIRSGLFGNSAVVRRGMLVVHAKDAQFHQLAMAAVQKDPTAAALLADMEALLTTPRPASGLLVSSVLDLLTRGSSGGTRQEALRTKAELPLLVGDWGQPGMTAAEVLRSTDRVLQRVLRVCRLGGVPLDYTVTEERRRMLFEDANGRQSPLFKRQGEELRSYYQTYGAMGLSEEEAWRQLTAHATKMPGLGPRPEHIVALTSDTPAVVTVGSGSTPPQGAAVPKAPVPSKLPDKVLDKGKGPGKLARAAAARQVEAASQVATDQVPPRPPSERVDTCIACKAEGHKVTACPTTVFVAGIDGTEKPWTQCWTCHQFGHVKFNCPSKTTPASASQLNGSALSSAGEGSGR
jgi:hypothetical protein